MLESLNNVKNVFKLKEIREKLLYTFLMMIVIRLGSQLPVPGVDRTYFSNWFAAQTGRRRVMHSVLWMHLQVDLS